MIKNSWLGLLLKSGKINKIAIANPKIAPYGKAAEEALTKLDLFSAMQQKLVYGESLSQVNTYITTGAVDVGFTSQALVMDQANKNKLYWKLIEPNLYQPIAQGMVILKTAGNNTAVQKFYQYILSTPAKVIFQQYGYHE